jgi:enamine deaminase RidA (YjgF/YER057c/UK114 family)
MDREYISTNTPWEAIAGYSRVVRVGNRVFVSGTSASNADGVIQHVGDVGAQTTFILHKIEAALNQIGVSLEDVVRTRIYVQHIEDWEAVALAHGEVFGSIRPASTLVRAAPIDPQMLVEIDADALIMSSQHQSRT